MSVETVAHLSDHDVLMLASARPWYYDGRDIFSEKVGPDGHRLVLPLPDTFHPSQRVSEYDAELIVRAVNAWSAEHEQGHQR